MVGLLLPRHRKWPLPPPHHHLLRWLYLCLQNFLDLSNQCLVHNFDKYRRLHLHQNHLLFQFERCYKFHHRHHLMQQFFLLMHQKKLHQKLNFRHWVGLFQNLHL